MPMIDCSDGPVPLADTPVGAVETLYASVLCMTEELDRALPRLPQEADVRLCAQASLTRLQTFAAALLAWTCAQEDRRG